MPKTSKGNLSHSVVEGDTLVSIADQFGFRNWEIIWNHDKNASLRAKRDDPQILMPGDSVWVPQKEPKLYECETTRKHTFKLKKLDAVFRAQLKDEDDEPFADKDYELKVDGQTFHGKTNGEGLVQQKVPPGAKTGDLTLWPNPADKREVLTWKLQLGHLDPSDSITGSQARLTNLGYYTGALDGKMNPDLNAALEAFQADQGIDPTGELDDATKAALAGAHDIKGE